MITDTAVEAAAAVLEERGWESDEEMVEDVRAALADGLIRVTELARLDRAARRVVLGIEVQDRPAAALVGEIVDGARLVG